MTMASSGSFAGVMAIARTRSSIVVIIGALAAFVIVASFVLTSYPIAITSQQNFLGESKISFVSGNGLEAKSGSDSGIDISSSGRKDGRVDDGSEVKSDSESSVELSSAERKEVKINDGSEAKSDSESTVELSSEEGKSVKIGDGSEVKRSESGTDISSNGRKDPVVGNNSEEKGNSASGADLSSDEKKKVKLDDGSEAKRDKESSVELSSEERKEVTITDGSEAKSDSESTVELSSEEGKAVKIGDGSEVKSLESGTDISSHGGKDPVVGDGSEEKGNSASGADLSSDERKKVKLGDGSEAKSDSESSVEPSSEERKEVKIADGSEVKSDSDSSVELSSEERKEVKIGDGSESKSLESGAGISSKGGKDPGVSDGSEVKGDSTSGADLSSDKRKQVEMGNESEVKSNSESGGEVSSDKRKEGGVGNERKDAGTEDGSVPQDTENKPDKVSSSTRDDSSAPLNATKEVPLSTSKLEANSEMAAANSCDLYQGKWIYDPAGPLYTNNTCPIITQMQNCQGNLRPDKDYENYRWKPDQCDLPRFSPRKFLELMRGKTLAFIGDSVARNQMESMLCILWQEETPKNRGNRHMQRWYFRSTSTMIVRIWSSWLVHQTPQAIDFAPEGVTKVHLDIPDQTFMEFLPSFDVVVLSSGHWFAKQSVYVLNNKIVGGQLWWPKDAGNMRVNNVEAFGISVETALTALANNPNFTGLAIVRSYSPDHYEGGAWNTGGSCTGKVKPASEVVKNGFTDVMHEKQTAGFLQAVAKSGTGGSKLRFMDITEVFGYRADGHPGPYRSPDPNKKTKRGPHGEPPPQDCLHWCMPGPVDTWNEILLEIIRRKYESA